MALHISHISTEWICRIHIREVSCATSNCKAIFMVHISPKLHTMLGQNLFLIPVRKVLKDNHSIVVHRPDVICISLEDINTRLIVTSPSSNITIVSTCILLSESLSEVETETIHVIFSKEILEALLHMLLNHCVLMIHIMIYIVRMLSIFIEPRVVCSSSVASPPHLCPRM